MAACMCEILSLQKAAKHRLSRLATAQSNPTGGDRRGVGAFQPGSWRRSSASDGGCPAANWKGQRRWWGRQNKRRLLARKRQGIKTRLERLRSLAPSSPSFIRHATHTHPAHPHALTHALPSTFANYQICPAQLKLSVTTDGQLTGSFIQDYLSWRWV